MLMEKIRSGNKQIYLINLFRMVVVVLDTGNLIQHKTLCRSLRPFRGFFLHYIQDGEKRRSIEADRKLRKTEAEA